MVPGLAALPMQAYASVLFADSLFFSIYMPPHIHYRNRRARRSYKIRRHNTIFSACFSAFRRWFHIKHFPESLVVPGLAALPMQAYASVLFADSLFFSIYMPLQYKLGFERVTYGAGAHVQRYQGRYPYHHRQVLFYENIFFSIYMPLQYKLGFERVKLLLLLPIIAMSIKRFHTSILTRLPLFHNPNYSSHPTECAAPGS